MKAPRHSSYCFKHAAQWQAGFADQLDIGDAGMITPEGLEFEAFFDGRALSEAMPSGAPFLIGLDLAGAVYGVCADGELWRITKGKAHRVTKLAIGQTLLTMRELVVGVDNIWLLAEQAGGGYWGKRERVLRYSRDNGASLPSLDVERKALAIAGDNDDGVWVLLGGDADPASLNHYDKEGRRCQRIALPDALTCARLDVRGDCRDGAFNFAVVLDRAPQVAPCEWPLSWRLWCVNLCHESVWTLHNQLKKDNVCRRAYSDFLPDLLAIDAAGQVHLLAAESGESWRFGVPQKSLGHPQHHRALVKTARIARVDALVSEAWLPVTSLVAAESLLLASDRGLAKLVRTGASVQANRTSTPSYISPMLVSPEGEYKGWLRVDLRVAFDKDTLVEISVAASDDPDLIAKAREIETDVTMVPVDALRRLNALLPWRESDSRMFRGSDWPAEPGQSAVLRFPLQAIQARHLWLRLRIFPAAQGAEAAHQQTVLRELRVIYPNISYTRFLPAIYQQDAQTAKSLRRFLVMFESLFGDLNRHISELPQNIDPTTAPAHWLVFLLRWLGLPPAPELSSSRQRELLVHAPELTRLRGTLTGLNKLLALLIVNGEFFVRDAGEESAPWVLPADRPLMGARLGRNTAVCIVPVRGFILQRACLGHQRLGFEVQRREAAFAQRSQLLDIRVVLAPGEDRVTVSKLLKRYLNYFVPAQCRYQLHFVRSVDLKATLIVGGGAKLKGRSRRRLGDNTVVGTLPLAKATVRAPNIVVGQSRLRANLTL